MAKIPNVDRIQAGITLAHLVDATSVLFSSPGKTQGFLYMGANDPEGKGTIPQMRYSEVRHLERIGYIKEVKAGSSTERGRRYVLTDKGKEAYNKAVDEFVRRAGNSCNERDFNLLTNILRE